MRGQIERWDGSRPGGMFYASGTAIVTYSAAGNIATATVTLPAAAPGIPRVFLTPEFGDFGVGRRSVTTTGFSIQLYSATSRAAGLAIAVDWMAVL